MDITLDEQSSSYLSASQQVSKRKCTKCLKQFITKNEIQNSFLNFYIFAMKSWVHILKDLITKTTNPQLADRPS
jgi:hypothetical protein